MGVISVRAIWLSGPYGSYRCVLVCSSSKTMGPTLKPAKASIKLFGLTVGPNLCTAPKSSCFDSYWIHMATIGANLLAYDVYSPYRGPY